VPLGESEKNAWAAVYMFFTSALAAVLYPLILYAVNCGMAIAAGYL